MCMSVCTSSRHAAVTADLSVLQHSVKGMPVLPTANNFAGRQGERKREGVDCDTSFGSGYGEIFTAWFPDIDDYGCVADCELHPEQSLSTHSLTAHCAAVTAAAAHPVWQWHCLPLCTTHTPRRVLPCAMHTTYRTPLWWQLEACGQSTLLSMP